MLEAVFEPAGFSCSFAFSGEEALKKYKADRFDVVLVDIAMQPMDGLTLLKELKAHDGHAMVIMMTGYSSAENAMKSLKFGAFDYVQKPFRVDELVKTMRRAAETRAKVDSERERLLAEVTVERSVDLADFLLGESPAIRGVRQVFQKLVQAATPALLQGEPGTGKRALAEKLHQSGPRAAGPFKGIDCKLANAAELGELLMNPDGSPGAIFSEVEGGTLFLNHIEEMPKEVQEVLVQALAITDQQFRLICAANTHLEAEVDEPRLIDAFYFKITSMPIFLPPLRERREDIPALIQDVLTKAASPLFQESQLKFTPEAEAMFSSYPWPGNVTELSNVVCTVVAMASGKSIGPELLPRRLKDVATWPKLKDYLSQRERAYLKTLLKATGNDRRRAAEIAGITDFPPFL